MRLLRAIGPVDGVAAEPRYLDVFVPPGRRKIVAWAPGARLVADWVEVQSGSPSEVALKLEPKSAGHTNKLGRPYGSYE